jgi:hypothetical protein
MNIEIAPYYELLKGIPKEDYPEDMERFYCCLAYEYYNLLAYAKECVNPQIVFNQYRKAGTQYIWEFFVNDLSVPRANEYNFHGQNTSQWKYAGCILLDHNKVSTHH